MSRTRLYTILTISCVAGYIWLIYTYNTAGFSTSGSLDVCIFKHVTNIPCPSCGSTRSILSMLQGNFSDALYWNPIGLILGSALLILPVWICMDLIKRKCSLLDFYLKAEKILQRRIVAIPAISIVFINWIWNIYKGV